MKLPPQTLSFTVCSAYFSYWSMHFFRATKVFGRQFRFLTHWGFTFAMLTKLSQLLLGEKYSRTLALLSTLSGIINLTILIIYWSAALANPAFFLGQLQMPLWHNIIMHALSPIVEVVLSLQMPVILDIKHEFMAVNGFAMLYILWLECLVRPFSVLPYQPLKVASMTDRLGYYAIALVISNILLCAYLLARDCWHGHRDDKKEKSYSVTPKKDYDDKTRSANLTNEPVSKISSDHYNSFANVSEQYSKRKSEKRLVR